MIKKLFAAVMLLSSALQAQTVAFHENFDNPSGADSVVTTAGGNYPDIWTLSSAHNANGGQAISANPTVAARSYTLYTDTFSTLNENEAYLSFRHAALLFPTNRLYVEVSKNNGGSWQSAQAQNYLGKSSNFGQINYFMYSSYPEWQAASMSSSLWKQELFNLKGLANDTSSFGGVVSGAANVIVRLRLESNFQNSGHNDVLYIDDIKIETSSCELIPPVLKKNVTGCSQLPEGPVNSTTLNFSILATDNDYVQQLNLFYQINGGSLQSTSISSVTALHSTTVSISNNDTLEYYFEAQDPCGNTTRFPSQGFKMAYHTSQYPTKCNDQTCADIWSLSLPLKLSFEGNEWTPVDNSDKNNLTTSVFPAPYRAYSSILVSPPTYGWVLTNGPTHSATGPNQASDGSNYLYFENNTNPIQSNWAFFTLPCFYVDSTQPLALEFDYHMFGDDIDRLWVDVDTGTTTTSWQGNVVRIIGAQQPSADSPWKRATLFLDQYSGKTIKVRFKVRGKSNDLNHIAIDNITINQVDTPDLSIRLDSLFDYPASCSTDSISPQMVLTNYSSQSFSNITVSYSLDGTNIGTETVAGPIAGLSNFNYQSGLKIPRTNADQNLKITISHPQDSNADNDTTQTVVGAQLTALNMPYLASFDVPGSNFRNTTDSLIYVPQGSPSWQIVRPSQYNNQVNPPLQKSYTPTLLKAQGSSNTVPMVLETSCVSPTSDTRLYFASSNIAGTKIRVYAEKTDGTVLVYQGDISSGQINAGSLYQHSVNLNAYDGEDIKLRLEVFDSTNQVYLKDFQIIEAANADAGLVEAQPSAFLYSTSSGGFQFRLTFNSDMSVGSCDIQMIVKDTCNTGNTYQSNIQAKTINSFNNGWNMNPFTFSQPLPVGSYEAKLFCDCQNDNVAENDTLYNSFLVTEVESLPYFNDFESCELDFRGSQNGLLQWEIGAAPSGTPHQGSTIATTNLDSNLISPFEERLVFPVMDLANFKNATIEFKANTDLQGQARLEMLTLNGWKVPRVQPGSDNPVLFGNSGGWKNYKFILSESNLGQKLFRITVVGGNMSVDDVSITYPPQKSLTPLNVKLNNSLPVADSLLSYEVDIYNNALTRGDSFKVLLLDENQNVAFQKDVYTSIRPEDTLAVNLNHAMAVRSPKKFSIVTALFPGEQDALPNDDTLEVSYTVLDPDSLTMGCNSFEGAARFASISADGYFDTLWQVGAPAKNLTANGYQSDTAWYTSGNYPDLSHSYLYTPTFKMEERKCYRLSFYHQFDTELNSDGGNVQVSLDSGKTWEVLGREDSLWYNSRHVFALNVVEPGFSGMSNGWQYAETTLNSYYDNEVQFRFQFASDFGGTGEGWVIDQVCMEELVGDCEQVSEEEYELTEISFYPNPAKTHITFQLISNAKHQVMVTDQQGKVVKQFSLTENNQQVDISSLAAGVYHLRISNNKEGFTEVRQLIRQ